MRTVGCGEKILSKSLKITFGSTTVPDRLRINYSPYRVRPFDPPPIQCFRCQRIGHTIGSCKSPEPRCLFCKGSHLISDKLCNTTTPKCANCDGTHKANSYLCNYLQEGYKQNKERLERRKNNNQIYQKFENPPLRFNRNAGTSDAVPVHNHGLTGPSFASVVKGAEKGNYKSCQSNPKTMVDASTQTLKEPKQDSVDGFDYGKLYKCLLELFCSSILTESMSNKGKLIKSALAHSFGTNSILDISQDRPEEH